MFPNPQDALPLPPRPNLSHYKKLAKDLVKSCKSSDPTALHSWSERWVQSLVQLSNLTITPHLPVDVTRWTDMVEEFARKKLAATVHPSAKCSLAGAQFVIARSHGFLSWPKLAKHVEALTLAASPISCFEAAADAIVTGDLSTLTRLLREDPQLIRARSTREHRATLLHYVSANGVEGFRQKTPANAPAIALALLRAGAAVDAEADVYGGRATTLGLTATSMHPREANVQIDLLQLLLDHGAQIDHPQSAGNSSPAVIGCLHNGCPEAAAFLAERGARLNLESAAGIGRLDAVKTFFLPDGSLKPPATQQQLHAGFFWVCTYGHTTVVEFLLDRGVPIDAHDADHQTGLHWAVIGAHPETVRFLLSRGAPLETKNIYGGTVLAQALWSAVNSDPPTDYASVIEPLLAAGALIEPGTLAWLEKQPRLTAASKSRIASLLRRFSPSP